MLGPYQLGPDDDVNQGIYTGDHKELARLIPDSSVDLIFTDPPYPRKFQHVWYELGEYAPRILKPGGSLITLFGHYQLPVVMEALSGLDYHWIGWLNHTTKRTLFGYKIVCGGKPLIWFAKGRPTVLRGFWWDTISPSRAEKSVHEWQQAEGWAMRTINQLADERGVILDPFVGGGTVPAVCKKLGRRWLAFEVKPKVAKAARERVFRTEDPMLQSREQVEQLPLWG